MISAYSPGLSSANEMGWDDSADGYPVNYAPLPGLERIVSDDPELEQYIADLELELGIVTPRDRWNETALFLDFDVMTVAAALGQEGAERFFGHREWANYLKARIYTRQYGDQPLTLQFVLDIHKILMEDIYPPDQPSIKDSVEPKGGRFVNGVFSPIEISASALAALRENPHVDWVPDPAGDSDGLTGTIRYMVADAEGRKRGIQEICQWYNAALPDCEDIISLAAVLQRKFISLHPLAPDYNGRVSRLLMYWSLERTDYAAGVGTNFDEDIFRSEDRWVSTVTQGIAMTRLSQVLIDFDHTGLSVTPEAFEYRRYLRACGMEKVGPVPSFEPSANYDPAEFAGFLERLQRASGSWSQSESEISDPDWRRYVDGEV
jgi:hypothetical protein